MPPAVDVRPPRGAVAVFLAIFAVSVAVRLPQLDRPLSKNHEFCTALVLMVEEVWRQGGFLAHSGCPAVTWSNPGDKGVVGLHYGLTEEDGVYYYLSHLPMAYWAPALVFAVTGVPPSPLALQVINLVLHALTAWLFALFLVRMQVGGARCWMVALTAATLYLLMPGPLWYHGNVYMADMAVQLPWAWSLFALAGVWRSTRPARGAVLVLLLSTAVLAATEWVAFLVVPVHAAVLALRGRGPEARAWRLLALGQVVVAALVLGGCLGIYASAVGASDLWAYLVHRYAERGVLPGEASATVLQGLGHMGRNLLTAWGPLLVLLGYVVLRRLPRRPVPWTALVLAGLPGLMYLALFTRYAIHEFALLKAGFLLCAVAGWGLAAPSGQGVLRIAVPLALTAALGIAVHTRINRPGDGRATGSPYATALEQGRAIARLARPDEVVLVRGIASEPQLQWYARRNTRTVADTAGAFAVMRELGARHALLVDGTGTGLSVSRLVLP